MAFIPDDVIAEIGSLPPASGFLYLYYCARRNRKTGSFNLPRLKVLADLKWLTDATYFRAKKDLKDRKWIEVKGNNISPVRGFKTLRNESFSDKQTLKNDSDTPKNESPTLKNESAHIKEYTNSFTNSLTKKDNCDLSIELSEEKAKRRTHASRSSGEAKAHSPADQVFDYWKTVTGHSNAVFDAKRRGRINAQLKAYSVDQLKMCLDGWKLSDWHQGKNPGAKVFDSISLIFRGADEVEKFISEFERHELQGDGRQQAAEARPIWQQNIDECDQCDHKGILNIPGEMTIVCKHNDSFTTA